MLALSRRLSEGTFDDATSAASIATAVDELLALDPSNERDATSALALFAAYNVALERARTTAVANEKNSDAAVALLASVLGALRTAILARCPFSAELSSAAAADLSSPLIAAGGRGVCAGSLLAAATGKLRVASTALDGGDVVDAMGAHRSIAGNLAVLSRGGRFAYLSSRSLHPILARFARLSRRARDAAIRERGVASTQRCLFTYVAPLLNAEASVGMYGVASEALGRVYAALLATIFAARPGRSAAWIVLSDDGTPRLHPRASGHVWKVRCAGGGARSAVSRDALAKDALDELVSKGDASPASPPSPPSSGRSTAAKESSSDDAVAAPKLRGGDGDSMPSDADEAAMAIVRALSPGDLAVGCADFLVRGVALANAAAMLVVSAVAADFSEATIMLRGAIRSGRALAQIDAFVQRSNMHAVEANALQAKTEEKSGVEFVRKAYPRFLLDALTKGSPLHDMRMDSLVPMETPLQFLTRMPLSDRARSVVRNARHGVRSVLAGADDRMVVVIGPCSIHDECVALDYACRLKPLIDQYAEDLLIIMRVYLEKPRTTVGWKGFLYEPNLDGVLDLGSGIERSRRLLLQINSMGIPCASEILDPITPQYYVDLVSWGACGARTVESQTHRHMLSGTSMPVGMKNATSGDISVAANAIVAASQCNTFPTITMEGTAAVARTKGNPDCHIILRGGKAGPNYTAPFIDEAAAACAKHGIRPNVMIDCSHGNSLKDYRNQPSVAASVASQVAGGDERIVGVMVESHITEGKQSTAKRPLTYGQSVTDSCISISTTADVLENLAAAVRARRASTSSAPTKSVRRASSEDAGPCDPNVPIRDMRMDSLVPMETPNSLLTRSPPPAACTQLVRETRLAMRSVLSRGDDRMVVIVGPCSIHDEGVALDYATRLKVLSDAHSDDLLIIMRVYLEKPRTTVGWKGFLYEPNLDGVLDLGSGIERSRRLLLQINSMGMPCATEILDPITPQYYVDLVSWGACGARTVESQTHRHMLSGTSMPIGMKNSTSGDISVAANAIVAASQCNTFPTITMEGLAAVARTKGNPHCHIILRGGKAGPNYTAPFIDEAAACCAKHGLRPNVVIDCSHGNSGKDYRNQPAVVAVVAEQVAGGDERIIGVMIESHIVCGKQSVTKRPLTYGQSVTDSCISLETTAEVLDTLAAAVRARRALRC